ncbi:MAG: hypothetical protein ABW328_22010 [Ilumatobacteraceae bacterium]
MAHQFSEAAHRAVVAELDNERAATLGRTADRLERARRDLQRLLADPAVDRRVVRDAFDRVEERRWLLCVQREAIGLYDHSWVDRVYPPLRPT